MAKFLEYQGKEWLRKAGLPVPQGRVASTHEEAKTIAEEIGKAVAVKGQVQAGGRGKAGIVKLVNTPEEAAAAAAEIFAKNVMGVPVNQVLVEEKLDIKKEYYCSFVVNGAREARSPMLMFSTEGGMDIESVPEELLFKVNIDPINGLQIYDAVDVCARAGIPAQDLSKFASFLSKLSQAYKKYDCQTLEINPFIMTGSGNLVCADCKMEIDNSSVGRHPEFGISIARDLPGAPTELDLIGWSIEETDARGTGFLMNMGYDEVSPGYIGYHPIGGGSAMMGLDALNQVGLKPANYADTSGNPVGSKIYRVAKCVLSQPNIDGYLLGGFMMANQEQWHHAHAIVKVLREVLPTQKSGLPCVLLLCGNREDESLEILRNGLADLMTPDGPGKRIEIYGKEYVTDTKFIGQRLLALSKEYRAEKESQGK
ncbi:ATP-grasp domain-containing protein [Desulfosporosinus sp. BICA1-9]|uniref:ATP-grasp domain-containing protein n=1 Tax=Desulfosporosinus sp. BICA1-9 TaxID=1531958 RepID=UPI00054C2E2F|nr:ATP-grasp domain-containing protein [Desulfosporosinus sp. BICA1-9]KJS50728.1 MAG: succinyl-CoA synthetase subunit beta [Peptococcaceae bacterium BRH_c23]KJS82390.1 MAG: succinyl-CoA synthetase subunit beta [Desulfosporosinus sp. BICA1-9]